MGYLQFTVVGTVIGIAGLTTIWNYSREFVIVSLASVLVIAVYAVAYATVDSFIYLISAFMVFSLWLAVGTAVLGVGVRRLAGRLPRLMAHQRSIYVGVFVLVLAIIPGWSVGSGWGELDLSGEDEPARYAEQAIAKAAGGIILAEEPQLFALVYQAQVANPELDVMVVGPIMLNHDWYWDQLVRYYGNRMPSERPPRFDQRYDWILALNLGVVPVYATHDDRDYHDAYSLIPEEFPEGDLFRVEY